MILCRLYKDYYTQKEGFYVEEEKRSKTCCFTGHRSKKLAYPEEMIKNLLEKAVDDAIEEGYEIFITGMAEGTDIWAAEIVAEKKKKNEHLRLICAVPHPDFEKYRSEDERKRYEKILSEADSVQLVCRQYFKACYQIRNKFMVDRASLVIAVCGRDGTGTKNTIEYARRSGVRVVNVLEKAAP